MRGIKRWVSYVSRANYARHVRSCGRVEAGELLGGGTLRLGLGGGDRLGWRRVGGAVGR